MTHYKKLGCVKEEVDTVKLNPGERITKVNVLTKKSEFIIQGGDCKDDVNKSEYKVQAGQCRGPSGAKKIDVNYKPAGKGEPFASCTAKCDADPKCTAYEYLPTDRACQLWLGDSNGDGSKQSWDAKCYKKFSNYMS